MKRHIALCCLLLLLPSVAGARTKHALVIGLGQYEDPAWSRINGDRDAALMAQTLRSSGFTDVHTLVNEQATKQALVSALRQLARRCHTGDLVCIHFSGHGQRMTDLSGDEPDGWDEAWIPYDARRSYGLLDDGSLHMSDDDLAPLLAHIRQRIGTQGDLIVIVDACHSGDSTRSFDADDPPLRGVYDTFDIPGTPLPPAPRTPEQWLTLSACKDYQLNYEAPNGYGKLTYALTQLWTQLRGKDNADALDAIHAFMQRKDMQGKFPQTPVLTGDRAYRLNVLFVH